MYKKINFPIVSILMLVSAFFFSCSKSSDVGKILIPPDYLMLTTANDTSKVTAHTYSIKSLLTTDVNYGLLGSYKDPVLGDLKASFITQITISGTPGFTTSHTFDSVKLFLRYDTVYMNKFVEQEINIDSITEMIYKDSAYYHNFNPSVLNPHLIYNTKFTPKNDSILAIKLPNSFGQKLFNDASRWADTTFSRYFKGLYFYSNSTVQNASIAAFDLYSKDTKMTLYYHNHTDTIADTLQYKFIVGSSSARFNMFEHNRNGSGFLPDLANPEAKEDSVVYLQGAGGLEVKIQFPYLDKLKEQALWGVNRAEIVINADSSTLTQQSFYPTPQSLDLYYLKDDGSLEAMAEYITQEYEYMYAPYLDNKFVFDITYIAQKIITGKKNNNGFILRVRNSQINPSRIVLTSGKHSKPMKLKLTLTKLSQE